MFGGDKTWVSRLFVKHCEQTNHHPTMQQHLEKVEAIEVLDCTWDPVLIKNRTTSSGVASVQHPSPAYNFVHHLDYATKKPCIKLTVVNP